MKFGLQYSFSKYANQTENGQGKGQSDDICSLHNFII